MDQILTNELPNARHSSQATPTRLPTPGTQRRTFRLWLAQHWEWLVIGALLLIAALAHGVNMFHYPYFEDDEGTYMAQAWAVLREGRLAPYTYQYDHAPLGWIQIALWEALTGGAQTFGGAVQSGRVLMFLFHLGSVYLVYRIARDATGRVFPGVLAALLFTLSPYEMYFGRRVLLDNIAAFWLLLSIALLLPKRLNLTRVWASALALAVSILSKELTVFTLPVMAYLVYWRIDKKQRAMAVGGWVALVSSICSLYVLMAIIKGELFPSGTLFGGSVPHVSLLGSLAFQAARGQDGGMLQGTSMFWRLMATWMRDEPTLVIGGALSAVTALILAKQRRLPGILGAMSLSLGYFLARGGEVIDFYILPLLPLLALNLALNVDAIAAGLQSIARRAGEQRSVRHPYAGSVSTLVSLAALCAGVYITSMGFHASADLGVTARDPQVLWTSTQADAQVQATDWIRARVPVHDTLVIDMSMWPGLHETRNSSMLTFNHADYYWQVEQNPAIRTDVYHGSWRDIDYVVTTTQMLTDMRANHMTLIQDALAHCVVVARFDTGGWPVTICKVTHGATSPASAASPTSLTGPASAMGPIPLHTHALWKR